MSAFTWMDDLWSALKPKRRGKKRKPAHCSLRLEVLEDRRVPSTFTVLDNSDSSSDSMSLRYLLGHVAAGSTIDFAPSVRDITFTSGIGLSVGTNVNIVNDQGLGSVTINGNGLATVFMIASNTTATLSGLTITGGNGFIGGGIYDHGTLTVNNSTIVGNNTTTGAGGGISNDGTLTVNNSTLAGNTATGGGGIFTEGSATITNSTLGNNSASNGGGIDNLVGNLTVTNSTIVGNISKLAPGGGIENGKTATLNGDIIAGNSGSDLAGVSVSLSSSFNLIGTGGSSVGLTNGSNGNQLNVSLAALELAPLGYYGGPTQTLALLPGSLAIGKGLTEATATTDQRGLARPVNSPTDAGAFQSGALVVNAIADSDSIGLLTLRDAVNLADADTTTTALPITFDATVFASSQTITETAGTLTLGGSTSITVAPLTITGPSAGVTINGNGTNSVFTVNGSTTATLSGLTITNGSATDGGGIFNKGTLTIDNSTLTGNIGTVNGGGGIENNQGILIVNDSILSNNSATGAGSEGGGLYNFFGTITVTNSTLVGNSANSQGGGILSFGTLTVTNSTLTGNTAPTGGGIYNGAFTNAAILNGDIIVGNSGGDFSVGSVNLSSSSFNLIGTGGSGGLGNSNGNQINVSLAALNLAPLGYYGGATQSFALLPGSLAIGKAVTETTATTDQRGFARPINSPGDVGAFESGTLVVNTTADSNGVGLLTLRDAVNLADADTTTTALPITFDPTVFASSQTIAETAGTLTLGNTSAPVAPLTITGPSAGVTISGNLANSVFTGHGSTTATLSGLTITNGGSPEGGGIFNKGTLTVNNSSLINNHGIDGTGFFNEGTLSITNSTIADNIAAVGGGGINDGTLTIINSTFADNTATIADGGGLENDGTLTVINSTFVGNTAGNDGAGIYNNGTTTLTGDIFAGNSTIDLSGFNVTSSSSFNLIGTGGSSVGLTNGVNGNQLNVSLAALDLAPLGNYGGLTQTIALLPGSLALGKGLTATTATTDQRGFARPINSPSDVGAFEDQLVATVATVPTLTANSSFSGALVTFTDGDPSAPTSSYTAIINWGDGSGDTTVTTTASTGGQIVANGGSGFKVVGTHTYATFGTDTITITIADRDGNSRLVTLLVQVQSSTATTVTSSLNPSTSGQSVTFTTTVTPGVGTFDNGGTVQFAVDGTNYGAPVSVTNGSAGIVDAALTNGNHTITATYSGDTNFGNSIGTLQGGQTVDPLSTATMVTSSLIPSTFGQSVTFTATVTPSVGTFDNGGAVQFAVDGTNYGAPVSLSNSSASLVDATLTAGNHIITASYSGDVNFGSSSATLQGGQSVNPASTLTMVTSSLNPSSYGQSVTFTATVTPGSGAFDNGGAVQFAVDGTNYGAPVSLSNGSASIVDAALTVGNHIITATYSGDTDFGGSSGTLQGGQSVNLISTSASVTSSLNPSSIGQSVTFTATVTPGVGTFDNGGTVQFAVDGTAFGTAVGVSNGSASIVDAALTAGNHTITATYSGDTVFGGSSGTLSGGQTVNAATVVPPVVVPPTTNVPPVVVPPTTNVPPVIVPPTTNGNGGIGNTTQTLTNNTGIAPAFTSLASTTFLITVPGSFSVTFTGTSTVTVTESGTLPSGVTFNAATDVLSGQASPGTNGSYPITFTASNSVGSTSQAFTLTINSPIDELGAYRASNGSWSLDSDTTMGFNASTDQVFFSFSPPGAFGVAGDWTGTGTSKVGDFSNGTWHLDLNDNGVLDPGETFQFGQVGDQPVVGDWTGNGVTNIGVFRTAPDGVTGEFILDTNGDHIMDAGDSTFTFGLATDRIVIGDWNGAGKDEVGVFRDAKSFNAADAGDALFSLDTNGDHAFGAGDQVFVFGLITDHLIVGDWNGAGKSEVGVYRPATAYGAPNTAVFSLDTNGDLQFDAGDQVFLYGFDSDQFVSGHWAKTPPVQPEGTPQAQFAANGPGPGSMATLTEAQLEPVLQQAIAAWVADGASATRLESANVQIGSLDDNLVGLTSGNQITLDATADGWGWNTDTSNADFTTTGPNGLQATPGSAAAGQMDLLTVVEHELGHELGLPDLNPLSNPSDLMAATLAPGVRRQPTTQDLDALFASLGGPPS